MHATERELLEITGYKPQRKFADRQDYLKSVFVAVQKLTDDDFKIISDHAAAWANACVQIHNVKRDADIPDFDEVSEHDDEDEDAEAEDEDEAEDEPEADEADVEASAEDDEGDPTDDNPEVDEPEEKPKKAPKTVATAKPVKKSQARLGSGRDPSGGKGSVSKPKVTAQPPKHSDDVELDKWGCMVGSKNSQALALFEKGATTKEVREKLSGTYYNTLAKMVQAGHKMEKEGAVIKLIHKDALRAPVKKAKK